MIQRVCLALASLSLASHLCAQSFTTAGGAALAPRVSLAPDHTVGGLDIDAAGNLYYLDVDNLTNDADGNLGTRVFELPAAGGPAVNLYNLVGAKVLYGSFLRIHGGEIYFGESTNGGIYHGLLASPAGITRTAVLKGNADLAFSPAGVAWVSANSGGLNGRVYRLDTLTPTLSFSGDYSGPIAFDPAGNLFYGSTGGYGATAPTGIYSFTPDQLASTAQETFADGHRVIANATNAYLAFGPDGTLYQDSDNLLRQFDSADGGSFLTLGMAGDFQYLGNLETGAGGVWFSVTDYPFGAPASSAIYEVLVPEVSSGLLLVAGLGFLGSRRRSWVR